MSRRVAIVLTFAGEIALIAGLIFACVRAANAQTADADTVRYGRSVAIRFCGECHAVGPAGPSPLADAPPLRDLYRQFPVERMDEALELGMMDDHPRMPDFKLEIDQRQALTAFLSSFAPKPRPKSPPAQRMDPPPVRRPGVIAAPSSGPPFAAAGQPSL